LDFDGIGGLPDELMVRKDVMARKWVHVITLVGAKEGTETVTDIPELAGGVFKLGKSGERRYAPSTGRRWAKFSEIEPVTVLCGDITITITIMFIRGNVFIYRAQKAIQGDDIVCVFYYCRTYYKAVRVGGGGEWRTCDMRDDEPRPVCSSRTSERGG